MTRELRAEYIRLCKTRSDIFKHLPVLKELAGKCNSVTEFGVRSGVSTVALLYGHPAEYTGYDLDQAPTHLAKLAGANGIRYRHIVADTGRLDEIGKTDMLFIDTEHTYEQLKKELRHAKNVSKYIALHDTTSYPELNDAISEFTAEHVEWVVTAIYPRCNGLTVLSRV